VSAPVTHIADDLGEAGRSHAAKELLEGDDQDGKPGLIEFCTRRRPICGRRLQVHDEPEARVGVIGEAVKDLIYGPGYE
jgi:hypothetical protein